MKKCIRGFAVAGLILTMLSTGFNKVNAACVTEKMVYETGKIITTVPMTKSYDTGILKNMIIADALIFTGGVLWVYRNKKLREE